MVEAFLGCAFLFPSELRRRSAHLLCCGGLLGLPCGTHVVKCFLCLGSPGVRIIRSCVDVWVTSPEMDPVWLDDRVCQQGSGQGPGWVLSFRKQLST